MNAPTDMNTFKAPPASLIDKNGQSRVGNFMHTSNGFKYWPFDPKASEIFIDVIAHQLATQGRYNGATQHRIFKSRIFYSVAEHSVYCARYMRNVLKRPDLCLEALLHDGSEAYIGDLIRPLKYSPEFRAPFNAVELLQEVAIGEAFNLVYPFPKEIKLADEAVTTAEIEQCIFKHPDETWPEIAILSDGAKAAPVEIQMRNPYEAKEMFLMEFHQIIADRAKYRPLPSGFRV